MKKNKNKPIKDRNIYAIWAWNRKAGPHKNKKWISKNIKKGKITEEYDGDH